MVGGSVSTGFFFTRIFNSPIAAVGEYYLDTPNVSAANWEFDSANPQSIYGEDVIASGNGISENGTTVVIPEPATFGLMGVAALGLFLARKKARR